MSKIMKNIKNNNEVFIINTVVETFAVITQ